MPSLAIPRSQRGFILIMGLMFMLMCTLLGLAMFRSFGLQERMAGNTRDKQRAFEAAQSALQYAEWWLRSGAVTAPVLCSGVTNGNAVAEMRVCDAPPVPPPATSAQLPWPARTEYLPPAMVVQGGGGVVSDGSDVRYQAKPGLQVHYLGLTNEGTGFLYRVSAYAYGGNADTAAVVQSTYKLGSAVKDLGLE
jgi:type IV pilus assembly protein PilX